MRPLAPSGLAPVDAATQRKILEEHIPYRLALLRDGYFIPSTDRSQQTNQAFEAGAVSGRILLSFLGLGYDRKTGALKQDRHYDANGGMTDDVKAPDVGGRFVELSDLTQDDADKIARYIQGVHKACAHFTIDSDHKLDLRIYAQVAPIIFRLMHNCLPNKPNSWPTWDQ
jgi:hypothetical protein